MRRTFLLGVLWLATFSPALAQTDPNLVAAPHGDAALAKAVAKARETLPAIIALSRHPGPGMERFAVKVGLGPVGAQEFVWLDPFVERDGTVTGALADTPEVVQGYRLGQAVSVPTAEVIDWMYTDNGRMRGNYTGCALLAREGAAAVARFEQAYHATCEAP